MEKMMPDFWADERQSHPEQRLSLGSRKARPIDGIEVVWGIMPAASCDGQGPLGLDDGSSADNSRCKLHKPQQRRAASQAASKPSMGSQNAGRAVRRGD